MPPLAIEQDTEPAVKVYSWDEIRKHDKEGDAWVVKGGQVTLHRKGRNFATTTVALLRADPRCVPGI